VFIGFDLRDLPTWSVQAMAGSSSSQLFCPFRAVGFCCNHVPLVTTCRGPDHFVVTAVGQSFHQYTCDKLQLLFVGAPQPHPLECLAATDPRLVWASYGAVVKGFRRGREVCRFHGHRGNVTILLPFGEHLISIDDQNCLKIWSVKDKELYGELYFDLQLFPITCAVHPSTYLNKILLGSRSGQLQLWNIRTSKLIHSFSGWGGSAVLTLVQSPAVDVVGAGLADGGVVLHNLRYDETVMRFRQEWGPAIALSFRTDGINTLVSGSPSGDVAVWDLDRRRLASVIRQAQHGPVTGLQFLPSQPLLLSSGPDNALKMWIFDQSDGSARLLRSRCGHSAPPTRVRFWSRGGLGLLSSGLDHSLRRLSITRDVQSNTEFSQGSVVKKARAKGVKAESLKLPPITAFAAEMTRAREWDSVVTCHAGFHSAQTWNLHNHAIGKHKLRSLHKAAKPLVMTSSLSESPDDHVTIV
jgi:U3 small nucleolar RNA-associated protein 21